MATGGEEFGDDTTPLLRKTDDQDDGDAGPGGDQTTEFEPGASSTPAPNGNQRQTTLNRPGEEPSFYEFPETPGLSTTTAAKEELIKYFPEFDRNKIKYKIDEKNGRLQVGIAGKNKPFLYLLTKIQGKDEYQINKGISKEVLKALGKGRFETIQEKISDKRNIIIASKKIIDDPYENKTEKNKARERIKKEKQDITYLEKEFYKLKRPDLHHSSESTELSTFQKNEVVRGEREQELQSVEEKLDIIINDENSTPAQIESANERKNEVVSEKNDIDNDREREIEQLPLRDRLREKVKAIFKKYGFTVGAVFLAVGTTIGVVLSSISNSLKTVSKNVGNGLKTLGKKIAPILPGIIGAVVSFVLRTAGNVVGFLGKHAWLLILAVAAFLFERVMKRRG